MALCASPKSVLVTGIWGSSSTAYCFGFLVVKSAPYTRTVRPQPVATWSHSGASAGPTQTHASLCDVSPVLQRVALRTECPWTGDAIAASFFGETRARGGARARPRKQCPHTLAGTVETIDQDAPDAGGWLMIERCTLTRPIVLGKSRGTGLLGVPQMPEDTSTDNG